jgi:PKD repeat protein
MKKPILKLLMIAMLVVMSSLDAFSVCNASFVKTINGLTVNFQNRSTYNYSPHYYWIFGDGTFSTVKDPIKTYATTGVKSVRLYVSDSSGGSLMCASTVLDTFILISGAPTCQAAFYGSVSQVTLSVNFYNYSSSSSGSVLHYLWNFPDNTTSTLRQPTKSFTTGGLKVVKLTITDSATSCSSSFTDTLLLTGYSCVSNFTKTINGLTVTLNNTSLNGNSTTAGLSYNWSFSEGPSTTIKNPVKTFTSSGVKFIYLQVYDSITNCTSIKKDSFYVGPCQASFSKSITGLIVNLNNTSLNGNGNSAGLVYNWSFSEGPNTSVKNPVKTFTSYGIKFIHLQIYDSITNCTSTKTDSFNLVAGPSNCEASFVIEPWFSQTYFRNTSTYTSGHTHFLWSFSDSTTSTGLNAGKTYTSYGMKTIKLTLFDSSTLCTSTFIDTVYVNPGDCNSRFFASTNGLTVNFYNSYNPSTVNYYWSFGDGTYSTQINPIKTYASAGPKYVRLTISDTLNTCYSVYDSFIVVTPPCSANFTKSINGLTVNLTNTSLNGNGTTAGLAYYWYFSEGPALNTGFVKNPVKTFSSYGVKIIQLQIFDSITNCTSTKIDTFNLSSGPQTCSAFFFPGISGLRVTFANYSQTSSGLSNSLFYNWDFGDSTYYTGKIPIKDYLTPGMKIVRLSIFDSVTSCSATYIDTLFLSGTSNNCVANFTKNISGLTVNLTNTSLNGNGSTAGLSYYWTFSGAPNSNFKNPIVTFPSYGNKTILLTIYDSITNCTSTSLDSFLLVPSSSCQANFSKSINGLTVTFFNSSTNTNGLPAGLSYHWNLGDGTFSTQLNPVKTYATGGPKLVTLTITDSLQSCYSHFSDTIMLNSTSMCDASFFGSVNGLTVSYHNTSTNTNGSSVGLSYLWNFSDSTTSTQVNPVKTYATAGQKNSKAYHFRFLTSVLFY